MNLFNRILALLLALMVLAGSGAAWLAISGLVPPERLAAAQWPRDAAATLASLEGSVAVGAMALALALALLSLILIIAELRPEHQEARLVLQRDAMGSVTVAIESVKALVSRSAVHVEGVQNARARVNSGAKGLRIDCLASVDPSVSVAEVTRQLREQVQATLEHHLGQSAAEINIEAQVGVPAVEAVRVR